MIADFVRARRWFRSKARPLRDAAVEETFPVAAGDDAVALAIVRCTFGDAGEEERYVLPLARVTGEEAARLRAERPHAVVGDEGGAAVIDATASERHASVLLRAFGGGGLRVTGSAGALVFRPLPGLADVDAAARAAVLTPKEQTNTSIPFGDAYILKLVRKLDASGRSAELDMGEFLTQSGFTGTPPVVGAIEIERGSGEPATVGVVHRFVPNRGDAWSFTLEAIAAAPEPSAFAPHAARLGERVGEMHVVLAGATEPAFAPRRIPEGERRVLADAVRASAKTVERHLRRGDLEGVERVVGAFVALPHDPFAMRVHGDLHLGQILVTGDDFVLIDFEGEPARTLEERKGKRSRLADVAGMLRSFDYAAATALRDRGPEAARAWYRATASAFLASYRDVTARSGREALQTPDDVWAKALAFYLVEKCVYEVAYEANNRPDWIAIPREGLARLLDGEAGT